ncbi:alpha/beta fold hydrolase [Novosphingobium sp.]|uniref:alpha/beta fold hydrolase n=1 Tax=Novosphingobium sp. TaxID=1874826 RepID=UPI0038B8C114
MDLTDLAPLAFFEGPNGHHVAYRYLSGSRPALVFLPGYMSDMRGGKAQAVLAHAAAQGRACLLLDYSGCGQSEGTFAEGTLTRWRDEVVALIRALGLPRVILCGSSMGGWLMLLVAQTLPERVAALVGIAPAPDFTTWGLSAGQQEELADGHVIYEENPYGIELTPTHPGFWADGQDNRQLESPIDFEGPVRLLHGQRDDDVPWDVSLRLAAALRSADVQVTLIKDGDHRLSRAEDITLLLRTIDELVVSAA